VFYQLPGLTGVGRDERHAQPPRPPTNSCGIMASARS